MNLKKLTLTHYIFIGLFLGILAGWIFGESILPVADPLANLFLHLLRMAIMPLIISSFISAVVSVGTGNGLGRLGLKTFVYFITSSLFAILTGLVLVNLFKTLVGAEIQLEETPTELGVVQQNIGDFLFQFADIA